MRTASTHQPNTERTEHEPLTPSATRPDPLRSLGEVPWQVIKDSSGSATAVPRLLNKIAWGNRDTAEAAVGELRDLICQFGFVVHQATAAVVPYLWDLALLPHVKVRPQLIRLLAAVAVARQWETTAVAYPKLLNHRENHVVWERAARQAVRARRDQVRALLTDKDPEVMAAASELAQRIGQ
ncbi:hypothetical protein AB0D49_31585 [Streptomyces sp. NPDC048290]|uniref:hypothetical protein n=1 Tax=Streptomyces sp. NPDC048290 TaxID=3155811 RepID=UPI003415BC4F